MFKGYCSQCGGRVYADMEENLVCSGCGSVRHMGPIIPMPPPLERPKYPEIFPPDCCKYYREYWFKDNDFNRKYI